MAKRSRKNRLARRLLAYALDELYVFEDDDIENELDIAILKFRHLPDWRVHVRGYMFSKQSIRERIGAIAQAMFK